jgi:hypothetical protein
MGSRIWEGVVWYFAIASGFFMAAATGGEWEAGEEGSEVPFWGLALMTAGFTFWALRLRKRRRSRVTEDDPPS